MLKKIACSILAVMLITTQAFALSGKMTGGFPDKSTFQHTADDYQAQQRAGYGYLPQGLTFYKDFTKIPAGTYFNAVMGNLLNADYSIGSPVATFTSTSGSFTISANGYNATTANDEVLKYLIAGNRTAAQETIVIKLTLENSNHADTDYFVIDTDTKQREIKLRAASSGRIRVSPNLSDNGTVNTISTDVPTVNITYVISSVFQNSSPNATLYINGVSDTTSSTNTWTGVIAWGTSWYLGCRNLSDQQTNAYYASIAIFNRPLTASEELSIKNIM